MSYSMYLALALATAGRDDPGDAAEPAPDLPGVLEAALGRIRALAGGLRQGSVSPLVAARFEKDLQQATRELGRLVTQWTYNQVEPDASCALPREVRFEGSSFRR